MSYNIVLAIYFSGVVAVVLFFIIRRRREKPSDFAAGIARSLSTSPARWEYSSDEEWIISEDACVAISLQSGNFGRVTSRRYNSGSAFIEQFYGADKRAFGRAVNEWRELTAIDRKQIAEQRKHNALAALSGARP